MLKVKLCFYQENNTKKHFKKPNHNNNNNNNYSTTYPVSNFQSKKRVRENLIRLKKNQQKER